MEGRLWMGRSSAAVPPERGPVGSICSSGVHKGCSSQSRLWTASADGDSFRGALARSRSDTTWGGASQRSRTPCCGSEPVKVTAVVGDWRRRCCVPCQYRGWMVVNVGVGWCCGCWRRGGGSKRGSFRGAVGTGAARKGVGVVAPCGGQRRSRGTVAAGGRRGSGDRAPSRLGALRQGERAGLVGS